MRRRLVQFLIPVGRSGPLAAGPAVFARRDLRDDRRGWEAVGRLDFAAGGFRTGVLIAATQGLTGALVFNRPTRWARTVSPVSSRIAFGTGQPKPVDILRRARRRARRCLRNPRWRRAA